MVIRVSPLWPWVARAISAAGRRSASQGIDRPGAPWRTLVLARDVDVCRSVANAVQARLRCFDLTVGMRSMRGFRVLVGPHHFGEPRLQSESIAPRGSNGNDSVGQLRTVRAHQQSASFRRQEGGPAVWADEDERLRRSADDLRGDAPQHRGPKSTLSPGGHAQHPLGFRRGDREDHLCGVAVADDASLDVDDLGIQPSAIVEFALCSVDVVGGATHEQHPALLEAGSDRTRWPNRTLSERGTIERYHHRRHDLPNTPSDPVTSRSP